MAQDVAEFALERRECRHQRRGFELPRPADAVGEIIGWIIGKMSQICFSIQHWSAPSQALAVLLHRSAVVKVGLIVGPIRIHFIPSINARKFLIGVAFPIRIH